MQEKGDERILGSGAFVTQLLSEVDLAKKYRLANIDREKAAFDLVEQYCQKNCISSQALSGGSRLRKVSKARNELALRLTEELGLSFAEIAKLFGVSTSGISKIINRKAAKS
jgi:putative transposase